ncbi:MAG: hypothetical protein N2593_02365 [Patescibacteria group bacterium]|nr:hypothetical protein [Patescibacteria group bacterium]
MVEEGTSTQSETSTPKYIDVTIQFGLWKPYDEETVKKTGIQGVFETIINNRNKVDNYGKRLPDLIDKRYLHTDGRVTLEVINATTKKPISRTLEYEKINGRIEPHPKFKDHFVLKYQQSLTPKPVAKTHQPAEQPKNP